MEKVGEDIYSATEHEYLNIREQAWASSRSQGNTQNGELTIPSIKCKAS